MIKTLVVLVLFFTQAVYAAGSCEQKWKVFLQKNTLKSEYKKLINHCDDDFIKILNKIVKAHHKKTGYTEARRYMFSRLDNVNGEVCGVYTQECIYTDGIPNSRVMNCEHTWPKSRGAAKGMAKYDLHHLFPTKSDINSMRSSYPFCELANREQGRHGSFLGKSRINSRTRCFEPRDEHKGDVARGMMYFSVRYQMHIDSDQEFFFRKWAKEDPVNKAERVRDQNIKNFQGNENPFIVYPELVQFVQDF